jgi:hypothetical protein
MRAAILRPDGVAIAAEPNADAITGCANAIAKKRDEALGDGL